MRDGFGIPLGARRHEEGLPRRDRRQESGAPPDEALPRYLARFGIHELGALTPSQLFIFVAARNLAWTTDRFALPPGEATAPGDERLPQSPRPAPDPITAPLQSRDTWSDDRESAPIASASDLPYIYPSEWRLRQASPSLFYLKVLEREVRMPRVVLREPEAGDAGDEPLSRAAPEPRPDAPPAPNAYVLVDCSQSMASRDRRGLVARGAALAFLLAAWRSGYHLRARPFRDDAGGLAEGSGRDGLLTVAREVLRWRDEGSTSIQTACDTVEEEFLAAGTERRLDLLIISDGISRLNPRKPAATAHIHALIIHGAGEDEARAPRRTARLFVDASDEENERPESEIERGRRILRENWCDPGSFVDLWSDQREQALRPRASDVFALVELLRETEVEIRATLLPERLKLLAHRVRNIAAILAAYPPETEADGLDPQRLKEYQAQAEALQARLGAEDPHALAARNGEAINPEERERRLWQEGIQLREVDRLALGTRSQPPAAGKPLSLREMLVLVGRLLLRWLRRA